MRYPGAIWVPGDPSKVYPGANACIGIVNHSAEGYRTAMLQRVASPTSGVSWPFSVMQDGAVYQHYELEASCWHGGNAWVNEHYVGVEHEGVTGQELTTVQLANSVELNRWIAGVKRFPMSRGLTLFEHREVATLVVPNHGPTSCPSGRIPWGYYTEEADVKVTQLDQSDSIKLIQGIVANVANIVADANGCTALELETPAVPLSPGYKLWGIVLKEA